MIRFASAALAALLAIAWGSFPSPCFGQLSPPAEKQQYYRRVLIEDRGELSESAIEAIGETVAGQLTESSRGQALPAVWGDVRLHVNGAALAENYGIGILSIAVAGERTFDEEQLNQLWETSRAALESALRNVKKTADERRSAEHGGKMDRLARWRDDYQQGMHEIVAKLEVLGTSDSLELLQKQRAAMTRQLRELELDQVSLAARRGAIEERIDYLRELAAKAGDDDPVIKELQKIVEIREQQLERVHSDNKATAGVVSQGQIREYEAKAAEARIELLKAQRSDSDRLSGAVLLELNNELSTLFVQDAELSARHDALAKLVAELEEQANVSDREQVKTLESKLSHVRSSLVEAEDAVTILWRENEGPQGEITIRPLEELLAP